MAYKVKGGLAKFAYKNRHNKTPAEKLLRRRLQSWDIRFKSQKTINNKYIADFFLYDRHVVLEVDGEYHYTEQQQAYDERRTKFLESLGLTVVRISNEQVLTTKCLELKELLLSFPVKEHKIIA
jgi:very-short-patch-repair endonuclease